MKLNAVSNNQIRQTNQNNLKNNKQYNIAPKNVSFKGATDALIGFWNFIDGSRAWQFTIEDMCGTNFPRTIQGARSGYKYTGKVNVPALAQEAIREFTTGPTMSLAPFGILAVATGLAGKSVNIHRKNIQNLSYLASNMGDKVNSKDFKGKFVQTVVEDMLQQTLGKQELNKEDVDVLVDGIISYDKISSSKAKGSKKQANEALGELGKKFKDIVKRNRDDYKGVDFTIAKFSTGDKTKVGATNIENYVKYITSYVQDYAKANDKNGVVNLTNNVIESFKKNLFGKRVMTVFSMVALTGFIMSFIPKLYTLASGKTNPDTIAFANEAKNREGK